MKVPLRSLSLLAIVAVALWTMGCGQQQPGGTTANGSPGTTTVTGGSPAPPGSPGGGPGIPSTLRPGQHKGHGVVKAVDKQNKKVTIAHEKIASVPMEAMTMEFDTFTGELLATVQEGDTVDFILEQRDGKWLVVEIQKPGAPGPGGPAPGASPPPAGGSPGPGAGSPGPGGPPPGPAGGAKGPGGPPPGASPAPAAGSPSPR